MTHLEIIKQMDIDELTDFLTDTELSGDLMVDTPWLKWFGENGCECCKAITPEDDPYHEYAPCEIKGYCQFWYDLTGEKTDIPSSREVCRKWLMLDF